MSIAKRFSVLLIFLDILLLPFLYYTSCARSWMAMFYSLAFLIAPTYDFRLMLVCLGLCILMLPLLVIAYNTNISKLSNVFVVISAVVMIISSILAINVFLCYLRIEADFNPETVQSTMIEIDLQQLEDLQNNEETTMIYFGRPSCAHCSEIKPNLDILVNNSHSKVYYYNTEQDRDDNHDEMQPVLDTYGVAAVPALVVWAGAGETQEVYFNEDIVDYFLDTDRFSY